MQKSSGYKFTLVNGQVFMEGLEHTGALAGRALRSICIVVERSVNNCT